MKPPYFGYFALNPHDKAKTFDECLQVVGGDLEQFFPIDEFVWFYGNEDADDFLDDTLFKIFYPEGEKHDFYVYCGREEDVTLSNGKEYSVYAEWGVAFDPKDEEDGERLLFSDISEDEYEYLCNNYGHLVKKLTLNEFQDLLDNMDFPVDVHISNI